MLLFDTTEGGMVISRLVKVNVSVSLNVPSETSMVIVEIPTQVATGEMVNTLPVSAKDTLGSEVMASNISTPLSASVAESVIVLDVLLAAYRASTF